LPWKEEKQRKEGNDITFSGGVFYLLGEEKEAKDHGSQSSRGLRKGGEKGKSLVGECGGLTVPEKGWKGR